MPLRNVLRTPRRTMLTALGIGAAVTVFVGTTGTTDTLLRTIDIGEHEVVKSSTNRLSVSVIGFQPASTVEAQMRATGVLAEIEPELLLAATAHHRRRELSIAIQLIDLQASGWRPTVTSGRSAVTASARELPEIMLSEAGAGDLGVEVGDLIRIDAVFRNGSRLEDRQFDAVVVGLTPAPTKLSAYMDYGEARRFGLRGLVNRLSVVPADGTTVPDVQRELFETPGVVLVEPIATTATIFRHIVEQYLSLLTVVQATALALALLIALNTATIALDERSRENATMFAFGTRLRSVLGIAIVESAMIGLVGTLIGLVGGRIVVEYIATSVLVEVVPDVGFTIFLSATTVAIGAILGIGVVGLAPLVGIQRLRGTNIPNALRVVE